MAVSSKQFPKNIWIIIS